MSFEGVFKVLSDIVMADALSYAIVGLLTLAVSVLMHAMLPVKGLTYVFAPALLWGGLAGIYTASQLGFVASSEKAVNAVAAGSLGMIAALIALVLLTRLAEALLRVRAPAARVVPVDRRAGI